MPAGGVAPGRAAVLALEQSAFAATGEDALGVAGVDGDALRAHLLEYGRRFPTGDAHDCVAGGDEERRHFSATRPG
jgi:hypothetical protein